MRRQRGSRKEEKKKEKEETVIERKLNKKVEKKKKIKMGLRHQRGMSERTKTSLADILVLPPRTSRPRRGVPKGKYVGASGNC